MKKSLFISILLALFPIWIGMTPDQMNDTSQLKLKGSYVYNFIKYIEWPDSYKQGNFEIGILGNNSDLVEIFKTNLGSRKSVYNQTIDVKSLASPAEAATCHLVYILADNSSQLSDVVTKTKGKSTLIITEKEGLAKLGSCLNFVYLSADESGLGKKLKFEFNIANIEKYKLKIGDALIKNAIEVK